MFLPCCGLMFYKQIFRMADHLANIHNNSGSPLSSVAFVTLVKTWDICASKAQLWFANESLNVYWTPI